MAKLIERGQIVNGKVVLERPVPLPEGTGVVVEIEPLDAPSHLAGTPSEEKPAFFGMWADREDLSDSQEWVRKERSKWHQRASRSS